MPKTELGYRSETNHVCHVTPQVPWWSNLSQNWQIWLRPWKWDELQDLKQTRHSMSELLNLKYLNKAVVIERTLLEFYTDFHVFHCCLVVSCNTNGEQIVSK